MTSPLLHGFRWSRAFRVSDVATAGTVTGFCVLTAVVFLLARCFFGARCAVSTRGYFARCFTCGVVVQRCFHFGRWRFDRRIRLNNERVTTIGATDFLTEQFLFRAETFLA